MTTKGVLEILLVIHLVAPFSAWSENESTTTLQGQLERSDRTGDGHRKWVLDIFEENYRRFSMYEGVSEDCKKDYHVYETHLRNQTIWAVRMKESTEWPHTGLFAGVTTSLGNWDECLRSRGPNGIQGQYCLIDAKYDFNFATAFPKPDGWDSYPPENASAWEIMKMYETIIQRKSRKHLRWAMCIPSSCQVSDLQSSVTSLLEPEFKKNNMSFLVMVDPNKCKIQTPESLTMGFYLTFLLILSLTLMVLLSSLYDYFTCQSICEHLKECDKEKKNQSTTMKIFMCFSSIKNSNVLLRSSNSNMGLISTSKVISFVLIIIAHEGMLAYPAPKVEEEFAELIYQPFKVGLGLHGVVDSFLMTSGFLTYYFGLEETKKYGFTYYFCSIIFRWLRLMPLLGLVILFLTNIMSFLGDGPLFSTTFLREAQYCTDNWWTNILAINNIVNRKDMCLVSTWYVAVDFQLTLLAGLILLILSKNYKAGLFAIFLTMAAGILISAFKIAVDNLSGVPMPVVLPLDSMRKWPAFSDNYIQIYSRTGPYFTGCLFALLLLKLKKENYKPSVLTALSWIIATGIGWPLQMYGFVFMRLTRPYFAIEHILYGVLHRILVVLPVGTFYVMLSLRRIPIVSDVFDWKIFVPLGRLSYGIYLMSLPIQMFNTDTMRQIQSGANNMDLYIKVLGSVLCSVICALILWFLSEGPLNSISGILHDFTTKPIKNECKLPEIEEKLKTKTYPSKTNGNISTISMSQKELGV